MSVARFSLRTLHAYRWRRVRRCGHYLPPRKSIDAAGFEPRLDPPPQPRLRGRRYSREFVAGSLLAWAHFWNGGQTETSEIFELRNLDSLKL